MINNFYNSAGQRIFRANENIRSNSVKYIDKHIVSEAWNQLHNRDMDSDKRLLSIFITSDISKEYELLT